MQDIYFSTGTAIFLTLLSAAMWGSWMQIIKHIKNYPVSGIGFWLYGFSFVLVWGVTLLLAPTLLTEGIAATTRANLDVLPKIIGGGIMLSIGMTLSLEVMGKVGMLIATTLSGAVGSILGIVTSIAEEGLPSGKNALLLIILCTATFIVATFVCSYAAVMRDRDRAIAAGIDPKTLKAPVSVGVVLLSVLSTVLVNGWSIGTAAGTASGMPPILTAAYLVSGSFFSVLVVYGIKHTLKKEWRTVLCVGQPKKPLLFSAAAAICHYGGNLISIYAMPALSATLSFLFSRSVNLWTYFWGFFYKEFAGSKRKTYAILFSGILLFFVGLALLGLFNYGG